MGVHGLCMNKWLKIKKAHNFGNNGFNFDVLECGILRHESYSHLSVFFLQKPGWYEFVLGFVTKVEII